MQTQYRLQLQEENTTMAITVKISFLKWQDWRVHLEQMHQHRDGIQTSLTETKVHLDKLHDEISHTLEKIASREKYLNNQLEHLLGDFRLAQDQLAETKEKYRQASGGVTERSRLLAEVGWGDGLAFLEHVATIVATPVGSLLNMLQPSLQCLVGRQVHTACVQILHVPTLTSFVFS